MPYVVIVALFCIAVLCLIRKPSGKHAVKVEKGIPARMTGIHPDASSFWNTVDFYVRLGDACAEITDNPFSLSIELNANAAFSCSFFDIESARAFFPALKKYLESSTFAGRDNGSLSRSMTGEKICSMIRSDSPGARVSLFPDARGMVCINVNWN